MHIAQMAILLTTLTAGGPSQPTASPPTDIFDAIDGAYRAGRIDVETRHLYRVAALKDPSLLPASLQLHLDDPWPRSGTRYLVDAFQWVARNGAFGSPVHVLLQPPPDEAYVITSNRWPVQVSYPDASQQAYAEMVLQAAEHSFDVQIGQYGFPQPVMEPGFEPYRISLGSTDPGVAGYTAPYDENPATPNIDCFTYIVINPNLGQSAISTTAHELNHAMQATLDCAEVTTYWENTSTFIEGFTYPEYEEDQWYMMQYFQRLPWRALDYFQSGGGYQYGGVLWNYYLMDALAPADGPVLVREIWEAAQQDSWVNEPDYYDAIETVAAARGADATSIEALYTDFAEARYFVTSNDDGQHIDRAGEFWSAEVAVVAQHETYLLPVRNQQPPSSYLPAPMGSNHIVLHIDPEWNRPVKVGFAGDMHTRWAVRVVLAGEGKTTDSQTLVVDPAHGDGELTVDPTGFDKLVLIVVNLGREDYDPDDTLWPLGEYTYELEPVVEPPRVLGIYPGAVVRGQQNLRVRLVGEGFAYGREFDVRFTDPLLQVTSIDSVTDTEVLLTMTVPASTNLGRHNLTVVNSGGAQATFDKMLLVVDAIGAPDPKPDKGGCHTAGGVPSWPLILFVLGALLFVRRRR